MRTPWLLLHPWRKSDAEGLYEYTKDPLTRPIAGWHRNKFSFGRNRKRIRYALTNTCPIGAFHISRCLNCESGA